MYCWWSIVAISTVLDRRELCVCTEQTMVCICRLQLNLAVSFPRCAAYASSLVSTILKIMHVHKYLARTCSSWTKQRQRGETRQESYARGIGLEWLVHISMTGGSNHKVRSVCVTKLSVVVLACLAPSCDVVCLGCYAANNIATSRGLKRIRTKPKPRARHQVAEWDLTLSPS